MQCYTDAKRELENTKGLQLSTTGWFSANRKLVESTEFETLIELEALNSNTVEESVHEDREESVEPEDLQATR